MLYPSPLPPVDPLPLVRLYRSADAATLATGRAWYREAARGMLRHIVDVSGGRLDLERAAAVVALLSPRKTWRENVRQALRAADYARHGADAGGGAAIFGRVRPLLRACFDPGADPSALFGPGALKTRAFWQNLQGYLQPVTVDVWAARAAGAEHADLSDPGQYGAIVAAYQHAACIVGDAPASVQAVVWARVRGSPGALTYQPALLGMADAIVPLTV